MIGGVYGAGNVKVHHEDVAISRYAIGSYKLIEIRK